MILVLIVYAVSTIGYTPDPYTEINSTLSNGYTPDVYTEINSTLQDETEPAPPADPCAMPTEIGIWVVPSWCNVTWSDVAFHSQVYGEVQLLPEARIIQ